MVWYAIPVLFMAPICLYIGLRHIIIYFRERLETKNLIFGLTSTFFVSYMITSYFMYTLTDVEVISSAFKFQYISISISSFLMVLFIDALEYRKSHIAKIVFGTCFTILLIAGFIWPEKIVDSNYETVLSFTFLNQPVKYHEPLIGILFDIQNGIVLIAILYLGRGIISLSFIKKRRGIGIIIIPLVIFLLCVINDVLVFSKLYKMFYIVDIGFFILMLSIDTALNYELNFDKTLPKRNLKLKVDNVTSMLKGAVILERIRSVLSQTMIHHFQFSLLLIEVPELEILKNAENFEDFNSLIKESSNKIRSVLRPYDETARVAIGKNSSKEDIEFAERCGNATFIVILPHCKIDGLEAVYSRLESEFHKIKFNDEIIKLKVGSTISGDNEKAMGEYDIVDRAVKALRICGITGKSFTIVDLDGTQLT